MQVNGKSFKAEGDTLLSFLRTSGYDPARVAVERNGEIVPRQAFGDVTLRESDVLEIVCFVGGG